eukprot:CAMPEP_0113480508 /NCGR_PEP_ID=MMETSP0014_2-20120614/21914_1 /TAXON_ID=2857 /ORGANISM="Nitzschia sp." /LENGTH=240 /DNA_ID=CAMNT_0000373945 /DNA_START=156 /DNA_END=875 /DNA_ORIENTATION=+ /assembly_acc=CAM_ASM_000159
MPIIVVAIIMSYGMSMTPIPSYLHNNLRHTDISQNNILVTAITIALISYGVFSRWFGQRRTNVAHEKDVAHKTSKKNTVTTPQLETRTQQHIGSSSSSSKRRYIGGHIRKHVNVDKDYTKDVTTTRQTEKERNESSLRETRGAIIDTDSINSGSISTATSNGDDEDGKLPLQSTNSQDIRLEVTKNNESDEGPKSSINKVYGTIKDSRLQDVNSFSSSDDGLPLSPTGYISFLPESSTRT